jgi:uroporphyrinogen-III synthase
MTSGPAHQVLRGRRVVVARPAGQEQGLRLRLEGAGAEVLVFPGMEIEACAPSAASLARLAQADWAVFVSANAVEHGLAALAPYGGWPAGLRAAAVGRATAGALERAGVGPVLRPAGSEDSEGLLAAAGWGDLAGKQIMVFRGVGGRETLATGLQAAGAEVHYAEVYRRRAPTADPRPLREALKLRRIAVILCATPWLVPHLRVAEAARALGITQVLLSPGSSDDALLATLMTHFSVSTA